ncbi:DUF2326 domain-containing protein [Pseudomonas amygdali]
MRLIELYANRSSFKRVKFNEAGASLVVGSRRDPLHLDDDTKSYNGVGKSLLVEIIHFCLGGSTSKAFKEHLPGWEFTLITLLGERQVQIVRSTSKQGEVYIDGKALKLKSYTDFLARNTFQFSDSISSSQLTFRALVSRFIRRAKSDYNDPRITTSDREPYTVLLRNLFLLGVDVSLIEKKFQLRSRQTQLELFEKNFKADPFIKEYYTGNKDASLQSGFLEEQVARLSSDLEKFTVADDFYDIEKWANQLAAELRELKNRRVIAENAIKNIIRSLETRNDIPLETIKSVYGELLSAFKPEALKSLAEVEAFHKSIIKNRVARLSQERSRIELELSSIDSDIKVKSLGLDQKLSYLSDKRALDQYAAVSAQLSDVKAKLHKLMDYQQLLHQSREEAAQVKISLAEQNIKTNTYLDDTDVERREKLSVFSKLAKRFYPEAPAGIVLNNNSGDNKIRYDFDVRIEADGSDGINAVKLFCYDLTVAILRANHNVRFIWHDSRLFSDIDPRQRAVLFQVAMQLSKQYGFQYIATVNEDQIDTILPELSEQQKQELSESIVLKLSDDGPEGKLLGLQVDMHYQ